MWWLLLLLPLLLLLLLPVLLLMLGVVVAAAAAATATVVVPAAHAAADSTAAAAAAADAAHAQCGGCCCCPFSWSGVVEAAAAAHADAYTCTIKIMGSMAYIVNQQAKRLEIWDDGKRPRTSYFVFSLQCVLILYDYIYDIISDPRFFHFQDKSNENEK